MGKEKKYRIARGFNLINLIVAAIFLTVVILLLFLTKNIAYGKHLFKVILPFAAFSLVMPSITHSILSSDIKNKVDKEHNWLAIFTIFLSIPFGLISAIFMLVGDVEKLPVKKEPVEPIIEDQF